jgi:ABC-type lipoprotein release transport system permease subunit
MERPIHRISPAVAMLLVSAIAMLPARAQSPDRAIKTQEARLAPAGHAVASTPADALGVRIWGMQSARLVQLLGEGSDSPGEWRDGFESGNAVVVGSALARRLSLAVGDSLTLVAPRDPRSASKEPHIKTYRIGATLPREVTGYDAALVL